MSDQHDPPTEPAEVVVADEAATAAEAAAEPEALEDELDPEVALAEDAAGEAPEPDWKDQYIRSVAELDNVRKRLRRDVSVAEGRGIAKLAKELLPAIDDLERALAHAEAQEGDDAHPLTSGIRAVQQQLLAALGRIGITTDSPKGERFDPHRHEALTSQPVEGVEPGVVVEVFQPGYVYADTVLRAAKVVVSA